VSLQDGQWTVGVADRTILRRVPNIAVVRGAQGVYEAHALGTTKLAATNGTTTFMITVVEN
jgi:hypothetical protein